MNRIKLVADFLTAHLNGPKDLSKGAEAFFLVQLAAFLDRLGIRYGIRRLDLVPSKAKMYVPGWEAEISKPNKELVLEVDGGYFFSQGDFIAKEDHQRIQGIVPVAKHDLERKAREAVVDRNTRAEITTYLENLSATYYAYAAKNPTPFRLKEALPL